MRRRREEEREEDDGEDDDDAEDRPQSAAAVRRSVLSVSGGDRIMEALERADKEVKDAATFRRSRAGASKSPNPLLLGMESAPYVLWVLRTVGAAELEQSLLMLPLGHVERLLHYLIANLKAGRGVEVCARSAVFLVKAHQNQVRH